MCHTLEVFHVSLIWHPVCAALLLDVLRRRVLIRLLLVVCIGAALLQGLLIARILVTLQVADYIMESERVPWVCYISCKNACSFVVTSHSREMQQT